MSIKDKLTSLKKALQGLPEVPAVTKSDVYQAEAEARTLANELEKALVVDKREQDLQAYREAEAATLAAEDEFDAAVKTVKDSWWAVSGKLQRADEIRNMLDRAVYLRGRVESPPEVLTKVAVPASVRERVLQAPAASDRMTQGFDELAVILGI